MTDPQNTYQNTEENAGYWTHIDIRDAIALSALITFFLSSAIAGFLVAPWAGWAAVAASSLIIAAALGYRRSTYIVIDDERPEN
jgi:hypothetical protein